jgi:hypothetical protein
MDAQRSKSAVDLSVSILTGARFNRHFQLRSSDGIYESRTFSDVKRIQWKRAHQTFPRFWFEYFRDRYKCETSKLPLCRVHTVERSSIVRFSEAPDGTRKHICNWVANHTSLLALIWLSVYLSF